MAPVMVGNDTSQGKTDTDGRDDEEDLSQVRGRVADVDSLVHR